jgi:hypothetical protein
MAEATRAPTSDDAATGTWTGTAGSRWQVVDDYPDTSGTDELTHGTTAGTLTFGFSAFSIPAGSTNIVVLVDYYDYKNGSQSCTFGARLKVGASYFNSSTHNPGNGSGNRTQRTDTFATNPATGSAWTVDQINGTAGSNNLAGFGYNSSDANPTITTSSVRLRVTYDPPIAGTLAKTLDDATLSAAGTVPVDGDLAKTLDDATLVAAGTVSSAGPTDGLADAGVYGARLAHWWREDFSPGATATWADEFGTADATQATANKQPTMVTTPAGHTAIDFDVDATEVDLLAAAANATVPPGGTTAMSLCGYYHVGSASGSGLLVQMIAAGVSMTLRLIDGALVFRDEPSTDVVGPTHSAGTWHTFVVHLAADDTADLYVDGTLVDTTAFGSGLIAALTSIAFGSNGGAVPFYLGSVGLAYDDADFDATDALNAHNVLVTYFDVIEGALAKTLDDATLAAAGTAPIDGDLAKTLDDATLAAAGTVLVDGDLAKTLDDATVTATGTAPVDGELAKALDDATLAAAGTAPIDGELAKALDDATLAAAGTVLVDGDLAKALDDATVTAAGTVPIDGELAKALDDATLTASGTVTDDDAITGSLAVTLDDATLSAAGTAPIDGELAKSLDDATLTAAGTILVDGDLAKTLDDATLSAAGTAPIEGTVARTLEPATATATGGVVVDGDLSVTLGDATLVATGGIQSSVSGQVDVTLDDVSVSAEGRVPVRGTASPVLDDVGATATGHVVVDGSVLATLGAVSCEAAGTVRIEGGLSQTLGDVHANATGSAVVRGELAATLDDVTLDTARPAKVVTRTRSAVAPAVVLVSSTVETPRVRAKVARAVVRL